MAPHCAQLWPQGPDEELVHIAGYFSLLRILSFLTTVDKMPPGG